MQHLIDKINELQSALSELLPMKEEFKKKLDDKFRLEFSYNSNHLEGNTLTYGETKLLLIFGKTEGNHDKREYDEIEAHDVAFKLIQEWAKDEEQPLTETRIKQLNEIILVKPFYKDAETPNKQRTKKLIKIGDYKELPNNVRLQNGEIFEFASVIDTPILMGELVQWYNAEVEKRELHPIQLAALFHYKFVRIHPFDDGNGRISRLLVNYVLLKNNFPPIVIKSEDKKNYLNALNKADVGNINAFVEYIAEQLIWSLDISIKVAKGENIEEPSDFYKEIELLKRKQTPPKIKIKKSKQKTQSVLKKVYFPLIEEVYSHLTKLDVLFREQSWNYFEEPKQPDYKVNMIPYSESLNEIFKYLYSVTEFKEDSYHHFKASYWLTDYNDKAKFSVEISFKIHFYETNYKIIVFVGQPFAGGSFAKSFSKIINLLDKEVKNNPLGAFKDYTLFEADYDEFVSEQKRITYANQISNDTLEYIKHKLS